MKYVGIVKSGDSITNDNTLNSENQVEDRILSGGYGAGFITGFVRNKSSSPLGINYYIDRREGQEILLGPNEILEFTHLPCDRIQFTLPNGVADAVYEYLFRISRASNEKDSENMLLFAELKKKLEPILDFVSYPEYANVYLNRRVGDDFNRMLLIPTNSLPLYDNATVGDGSATLEKGYFRLESGTAIDSGIGYTAVLNGVHNSAVDLDHAVNKIIFECFQRIDLNGLVQGGLMLSQRHIPRIYYYLNDDNCYGFQVDNEDYANYLFVYSNGLEVVRIDTGIPLADYTVTRQKIIHDSRDNSLEAILYDAQGNTLFRRKFVQAFTIGIEDQLFMNMAWGNKQAVRSDLYVYNWSLLYE